MEIGVGGKHTSDMGVYSGFFHQFPLCGSADVFIPFNVTAGNAPLSVVGAGPPHQQQPVVLQQYGGNADCRVAIENPVAGWAVAPLGAIEDPFLKCAAAVWTKFVFHHLPSFLIERTDHLF
jgi:hypothetical protein